MHKARVGSLRFNMLWGTIQRLHTDPYQEFYEYSWASTDALVAKAAAAHIRLLPVLIGTPNFLSCGDRDCQVALPTRRKQRRAWRAFVREAVNRYKPGGAFWSSPYAPQVPSRYAISKWQIWNEENNRNVHGSPKEYARMLHDTRSAMDNADPHARLVIGGLAGHVDPKHPHPTAAHYLRGIYKYGSKKDFDAVALHPYAEKPKGIKPLVKQVRRVMARHHDGRTDLDITEIGWGSDKRHVHHDFVETPKGQKRRLTEAFKLLRRNRAHWNLNMVHWFSWRDPRPGTGLCGFCYSTGLLTHHGHAKPAFKAFVRFTGGSTSAK